MFRKSHKIGDRHEKMREETEDRSIWPTICLTEFKNTRTRHRVGKIIQEITDIFLVRKNGTSLDGSPMLRR